jgi:adenylyltransferase/sulfurtransferase
MFDLSNEQFTRYARHIIIEEFGFEGQKKLLNSRVLVVGAGGLGSPVIYYLAAAGVGTIGIVENDFVDLSNLQRQILHDSYSIGEKKVEVAKRKVKALNPDVEVITYDTYLDKTNVLDIIKDYDVVVDCTDNFPTRFLLNDACYFVGKPLVHGAVLRFEGQVSVFLPSDENPCYRCIYSEPPSGPTVTCREAGVLGAVVGVIGSLQAVETIKLITGVGQPLIGKLLVYDALYQDFSFFNVKKDSDCPLCGKKLIKSLDDVDYSNGCSLK